MSVWGGGGGGAAANGLLVIQLQVSFADPPLYVHVHTTQSISKSHKEKRDYPDPSNGSVEHSGMISTNLPGNLSNAGHPRNPNQPLYLGRGGGSSS